MNSLQTKHKQVENKMNIRDLKESVKNRISTKLILNKENESDTFKMIQTKDESLNIKNNLSHTGSSTMAIKDNQLDNGCWTKKISFFINNSIFFIRKIICCSNISCEKEENLLSTKGSSMDSLIG